MAAHVAHGTQELPVLRLLWCCRCSMQVHCQVCTGDPGYLFTAVMLTQCAATLLEEREALLGAVGGSGGVYTVGTLFRNSSLVQRLDQHGVKFSIKSTSA